MIGRQCSVETRAKMSASAKVRMMARPDTIITPIIWTPEMVAAVIDLRAQGRFWREIADHVGVALNTVDKARASGLFGTCAMPRRRA